MSDVIGNTSNLGLRYGGYNINQIYRKDKKAAQKIWNKYLQIIIGFHKIIKPVLGSSTPLNYYFFTISLV